MRRQFGILVQIKVEGMRVGIDAFNFFRRRSLRASNSGEQCQKRKSEQSHGPGSYRAVLESANPISGKIILRNDFQNETILTS
jgi:hypothetical protein